MLSRRDMLGGIAATGLARGTAARTHPAKRADAFPQGFLRGAATAGHQVEGGNINADNWVLENISPTVYATRSGDACDHYHRYAQDIALLRSLGLNYFRFSLEWSRIEPEEGFFSSEAEIGHYRDVLASCHATGITPMVTLNHYTTPRWFAAKGGWADDGAPEGFARYSERVAIGLAPLLGSSARSASPISARCCGSIATVPRHSPRPRPRCWRMSARTPDRRCS